MNCHSCRTHFNIILYTFIVRSSIFKTFFFTFLILLFPKPKVVISARRLPQLEEVADEIKAAGGEVLVVQTDVSKVEDCENLVAKTVEAYGKIDVLVNNAGVLEAGLKPIDCYEDEDLEWVLGINTKGCLYCTRAAVKEMMKNNAGSIINLDSVAGAFGTGGASLRLSVTFLFCPMFSFLFSPPFKIYKAFNGI